MIYNYSITFNKHNSAFILKKMYTHRKLSVSVNLRWNQVSGSECRVFYSDCHQPVVALRYRELLC